MEIWGRNGSDNFKKKSRNTVVEKWEKNKVRFTEFGAYMH